MAKKTKKTAVKKTVKKVSKKSAPKKKITARKATAVVKKKAAPKKATKVKVVKKKVVKKVVAKNPAKAKVVKKPVAKKEVKKSKSVQIKVKATKAKTIHTKNRKPMGIKKNEVKIKVKSTVEQKRVRYSDQELLEFKDIINKKLSEARKELGILQGILNNANNHGTDDTASTFKVLEDGSDTLAKEEAGVQAARQKKFIEQLENALIRIENKTYGICRVTGKLIPKERLRAVPHTTQSIEAKLQQYRD